MPMRLEQQPDGTWTGYLTGIRAEPPNGEVVAERYEDRDECDTVARKLSRYEIHRRRGRPDSMPWNRPDNDPDHVDNRNLGGGP